VKHNHIDALVSSKSTVSVNRMLMNNVNEHLPRI